MSSVFSGWGIIAAIQTAGIEEDEDERTDEDVCVPHDEDYHAGIGEMHVPIHVHIAPSVIL